MISYRLTDPALGDPATVHRIVTSLLDPIRYPATDLVCAYHERWEIEITIDELDTHQRVVGRPLRSQQPVGVLQELYGLLPTHYLVRAIMHEAACAHAIDHDRISFVNAIRLIQDAIPEAQMVVQTQVSHLYQRLLTDLCAAPTGPAAAHGSAPGKTKNEQVSAQAAGGPAATPANYAVPGRRCTGQRAALARLHQASGWPTTKIRMRPLSCGWLMAIPQNSGIFPYLNGIAIKLKYGYYLGS